MEKLLISACILGISSRYDGKSKRCISDDKLRELSARYELVPFCPEIYGGLPTPRIPAERVGDRVITRDGRDVTENYRRGADQAISLCRTLGIKKALLKAKSPACGKDKVYDGTFSGVLTEGDGVAAEALMASGIAVFDENGIDKILKT